MVILSYMVFIKGHAYCGSRENLFKKGHVSWLKGTKGLVKASNPFLKGHTPWNKGVKAKDDPRIAKAVAIAQEASKNKIWTEEERKSQSIRLKKYHEKMSPEQRKLRGKKISNSKMGHGWPEGYKENQSKSQKKRFENEITWNKGLRSGKPRSIRQEDTDYRKHCEWREKVFVRDNYTCQSCKLRGVKIEADHIKMWMHFPELRYDLSNGQTLCKKCHIKKTTIELSKHWKNQYAKSKLTT